MYKNMQGKTCLVTGATSGIGKVTAKALAASGARVIITGRNLSKIQTTLDEIKSQTGNQAVDYLRADFSELHEVRQLAETYLARYDRLDVLVNNAGAYYNQRHAMPRGVELTLVVNHLAPFLLTGLLLTVLQASKPARIVNVASGAHRYGTMNFDDLGFKRGYFGMKAYARSKLANILFTYELARRLGEQEVTVNAVHPGLVTTDIWRTNFSVLGPWLKSLIGLIGLAPEEGADSLIYLASSPEVDRVTGKYFFQRKPVPSTPVSYDLDIARRLWSESERLAGIAYP